MLSLLCPGRPAQGLELEGAKETFYDEWTVTWKISEPATTWRRLSLPSELLTVWPGREQLLKYVNNNCVKSCDVDSACHGGSAWELKESRLSEKVSRNTFPKLCLCLFSHIR